MLFPLIQMANNDRQSACLIFDNAFYLYRTRLLSLYSEHKCNVTYKKHWRILQPIGLMITELSRLKKKGSKHGLNSDPSNEHCREPAYQRSRGNSSARFEQVFDKNST